MMALDDVYLITDKLNRPTVAEMDAIEHTLGSLPAGYREYMLTLGEGTYQGGVRVYPPKRIAAERSIFLEIVSQQPDMWERGRGILTRERQSECIAFADTIDSDMIVFHPDSRDTIYILPRHDDRIYRIGASVEAMLHWIFTSGILFTPLTSTRRYFESWVDRDYQYMIARKPLSADEFLQAIERQQIHDFIETSSDPHATIVCVFIKAFYGLVQFELFPPEISQIGPRLHLYYDRTQNPTRFAQFIAAIRALGFSEITDSTR